MCLCPAIFCGCTARFVSDLVGNPEGQFSHNEAQMNCNLIYAVVVSHFQLYMS